MTATLAAPADVLALHASLSGLSGAEKAQRLIAAGYVNAKGSAGFTEFYTAVLAAKKPQPTVSEAVDTMLHFVNTWSAEYTIPQLKLYWEEYKEQTGIDGNFNDVDCFIEDHGMNNLGFYADYADMMNDYDIRAVAAFIEEFGITEIKHFPESYQGTYHSEADFAEDYISNSGETLPHYVIVDWQATWDSALSYDYTYNDATGAVFSSQY
jgi:hypothetical protein